MQHLALEGSPYQSRITIPGYGIYFLKAADRWN